MQIRMRKNARQVCAALARLNPRKKKALLLPIQTLVMARHLLPLAVLARRLNIDVFYTISPNLEERPERYLVDEIFKQVASFIGPARAHFHRWALIVVADHGHFHTLAWSGSPLVHIGHGNPSKTSRRFPDTPWEYSHAPRWPNGNTIYTEMIESAEGTKKAIMATAPEKGAKIRVLGRLLDDLFLEKRSSVITERAQSSKKPSFLIISTLGEKSAFHTFWDDLVRLGKSLSAQYEVTFCPHPNEYAHWHDRLEGAGLRVADQSQSTEDLLVGADAIITDFSSICQKAALLGIPVIFCRQDDMPVWSVGATAQLYASCPKWQPGQTVDEISKMAGSDESIQRSLVLRWVNSYPGKAEENFTAWLQGYFKS